MQQSHAESALPIATSRARPRPARWVSSDRLIAVGLISPSVLLLAVFIYGFIGRTAYVSLVRWNDLLPDFTFVGLRNYERLFDLARFQIDLRNTLVFTLAFITVCLTVGLLLAILLDSRIKGEALFRT